MLNQVKGDHRFGTSLCLLARWGRGQKGVNGACQHLHPRKEMPSPPPPALTLKPVNFVSPLMSLVPFKLLLLHWSAEQACERASPFSGPSRGRPGTPVELCLTEMQSMQVFKLAVMGTSFPGTGAPGWGPECGTGTLCAPQGEPLQPRYPS